LKPNEGFFQSLCVGAQQPISFPRSQIQLRRLQDKMKMIAHQAIGMYLPSGLETSLA